MKMYPSKMQFEKRCFVTGMINVPLIRHHCLYGTHQRRKAEEDGLWVYLTPEIHEYMHHTIEGYSLLEDLKKKAQKVYEQDHTREQFIKRYGKNYL